MTHLRLPVIAVAALLIAAVEARTACGPTPEKYRSLRFGDTRFAVEEDCRQRFTQDEQFFLAGVGERLRSTCKLPRNPEARALVDQFTKAAALSLSVHQGVPSHAGPAAAFASGTAMAEDIPCNGPEAALLARGIAIFLKRTAGASRFIAGCVERYTPRYTEEECRCIVDAIRPVIPDADQRFFDRELVRGSIHRSPRIALTLFFSCGVSAY